MPTAASDLAHSPWFAVSRTRPGPELPDASLEMLSYYAAALLRRCDRPFRRQKGHWPEKSSTVLDHVERTCARLC